MKESNLNNQINRIGIAGSLINGLLFLIKFAAAWLSGSVAMITDSFNNLSDFLNVMITYVGLKLSQKPADDDHPYGHERFEIIAGFSVSLVMMVLAIESIRSAIVSLIKGGSSMEGSIILLVSVVSIILKGILMAVYLLYAKQMESDLLKTNALDSLFDMIISALLILAYFIQPYTNIDLDGLIGLGIGLVILYTAIILVKEFISGLLGQKPSDEEIQAILDILDENKEISGYHDLSIHTYGRFHKYALVHVEVDEEMALIKAHEIIDIIEDTVLEKTGIELDVHLDPLDMKSPEIKKIVTVLKYTLKSMHSMIHFHEVRLENGLLYFEVYNPNETEIEDEFIQKEIENVLLEYQIYIKFEHISLIDNI